MKDIVAIVLAAGRSRRMGAFKPLLPFGDKTVIEYLLDKLYAADIEEIIVVVGHRHKEIRRQLVDFEVRFALNPNPNSEMSESIATGVKQIRESAKALLIALVDHPAVPPEVVKHLMNEWRTGARLVQPEQAGRGGHPVLIDISYRDELRNLDPRRGLRAFFETHREELRRVPVDSPFVARDMDTWEDYLRLHRDVFGEPSVND